MTVLISVAPSGWVSGRFWRAVKRHSNLVQASNRKPHKVSWVCQQATGAPGRARRGRARRRARRAGRRWRPAAAPAPRPWRPPPPPRPRAPPHSPPAPRAHPPYKRRVLTLLQHRYVLPQCLPTDTGPLSSTGIAIKRIHSWGWGSARGWIVPALLLWIGRAMVRAGVHLQGGQLGGERVELGLVPRERLRRRGRGAAPLLSQRVRAFLQCLVPGAHARVPQASGSRLRQSAECLMGCHAGSSNSGVRLAAPVTPRVLGGQK